MTKPDICVAIPTYNRGEILIDTIKDVLSQSYKNLELVVVDQSKNRTDNFISELSKIKDSRFRYFLAGPPSTPAAKNFALNASRAPVVLFLDDDVKLKNNMVSEHLKALKAHPEASAIAGRVMQKGFPILKDVLKFDDFAISHGVFTATEPGYTNAFPGGNHSIRVEDALSIGGYDTRFYYNAFREESDMSLKMAKNGMKIYYEPKAELLHLAAHSGGTRAHKTYGHIYDSAQFYRNELFFTIRNAKHLSRALNYKYNEYCKVPSRRQGMKRRIFFMLGLLAAIWRNIFGKQIVTTERES